jgi:hypothetical protein
MKYFIDTEFLENGITIKPISIGIIREDGEEYYAVNSDLSLMERAYEHPWLNKNVLCHLPLFVDYDGDLVWDQSHEDFKNVKSLAQIADDVKYFISQDAQPELWYYYGAYAHVVLAQLFGTMVHMPMGIPQWGHELMQEIEKERGFTPKAQLEGAHNALADARWTKSVYDDIEHRRMASAVMGGKALPIPAFPTANPGRTRMW